MQTIIDRLKHEPVLVFQIPTIILASASMYWDQDWIAFGVAVSAALGALFARQRVTPN